MTIFGKLSWSAIPFDQPIPLVAAGVVMAVLLGIMIWVILRGHLPYLWKEWITSVDHKRIGVMYCVLSLVMLFRGFIDAIMMRSQQATAFDAPGYLPPAHFDQVFSAHGTIMIFFGAMPLMIGLMNFVVPLQLGARDVAFPTLNSVAFWLTASGAFLVNLSLVVGEFARTGWLPYPPLSELKYSPGVGVDYYLWAIQISGAGTLLVGVNLVTTILKTRAPGMSYLRMPMFCWTALATNLLIVAAFPILTATLAMLTLDRYLGFHFFTNDAGGNMMMFINLIWAWGHPEVYILVLPAFGVFSEVISTFSGKPLFGYRSMVIATMFICVMSFMVWLHHFFTMGAGGDVNAVFGIATSIIAVGTGVKIYNWMFTMYGGRVRFDTPMLWAVGFLVTFVIGGMSGVLLAVPPADFTLHNSLFLVAHFHNVIIGGVIFGGFAGITFWFPKAFGFRLHEGLGKAAFWLGLAGFYITFVPLYVAGLDGMTRRLQHYDEPSWYPLVLISGAGVIVLFAGAFAQATQLVVSIRRRDRLRDETGDPWNGRSLEWATPSPPPHFNFALLPDIRGEEPYWAVKERVLGNWAAEPQPRYKPIEMPRNSATGVVCAFFATAIGFGLIWHIWWLSIVAFFGAYATFVLFAWRDKAEIRIDIGEVAEIDRKSREELKVSRKRQDPAPTSRSTKDPYRLGRTAKEDGASGRGDAGPASKRIVVGYGFWIFLLSDIVMFAAFFAAFAVLSHRSAGGPTADDIFERPRLALETTLLLFSSFTCGLAGHASDRNRQLPFQTALLITAVLGAGFLVLEVQEFADLVARGAGPERSAFLSSFFALVACHGLHVGLGLLWIGTMMAQTWFKGFRDDIKRRIMCLNLFWHALDVVWVAIFSIVYLMSISP